MVINGKRGFTILEIVIAMTISLIVIVIITYFIGEINDKIASSQNKSKIYVGVNDLIEKINSKKNVYSIASIITQTGSYNNLLLTNRMRNGGLILGVVNLNTLKLDNDSSIYDKKAIGLKEINKYQLDQITSSSGSILDLDFYEDNVFPDLNMKSFTLSPFNGGIITEANFVFYETFLDAYKGKNVSELPEIQTYALTLDF